MISPETLDLIQKGGMIVLLLIAVAWLVSDRNRLLESLRAKDKLIAEKDDKLLSLSVQMVTVVTELKGLMNGRIT